MPSRIIITRVVDADELAAQIEPRMSNLGNAVAVRMQRLVPKRTWALHDTIATETHREGGKVITTVGAGGGKVDYELMVERGTSRMRAQPYMLPALLQSKAADFKFEGQPRTKGAIEADKSSARERRNARRRANYLGSRA